MISSPAASAGLVLAARRHRFAAIFIDLLLLTIANTVLTVVVMPELLAESPEQPALESSMLEVYFGNPYATDPYWYVDLVFTLVSFLYFWVAHARWGQTIGKRLTRTKVVGRSGEPLTPSQAGLRSLAFSATSAVPYIGLLLSLADALWIFRPGKRCLHDVLAGTVVIDLSSPAPRPGGSRPAVRRGMPAVGLVALGLIVLWFVLFMWS
ncbi:RDD family protein [Sphaerisporangium perillae]|uniref:RDD family protein n=1 Tax=Sphaerisporangium perillae TaxID=2935860 RepID=UPI00200DF3DD|nr:RDD family protein [Sphaerisporangium perillae]